MSWVITGVSKPPLLLDTYSGAAAAYSLRSLSLAYGGSVVRVRRSSDNTESDFTDTQVSDGTLTAFCGAGNGFVRTWYDQSGNGNNVSQATTAEQPQIVSSGNVILDGTRPAIQFVDTRRLNAPDSQSLRITNPSHYTICSTASIGSNQVTWGKGFGGIYTNSYGSNFISSSHRPSIDNGAERTVFSPSQLTSNTRYLLFSSYDGSALTGGHNGSNLYSTSTTGAIRHSSEVFRIGSLIGLLGILPFVGKLQELIVYGTDTSASRIAIESNINAHYAIY
jgi:hypothetical protein